MRPSIRLSFTLLLLSSFTRANVAEAAETNPEVPTLKITVVDGVVQPGGPLLDSIARAMQFLKKADRGYIPGKLDGPLPGYFTSAHVMEDGSPSKRTFCFPARQQAYFIFTFLHYHKFSGEAEWLQRAIDLADWNLAHSTPADAQYANLPWAVWTDGHGGGSADKDSTEPDKAAWFGKAYLVLYDVTKDEKYLAGAKKIAETLAINQAADGSWPFRVTPQDGQTRQQFGGAPVFYVEFFQLLAAKDKNPAWQTAYEKSLKLMLERNIEKNLWGTYHEDIKEKPEEYLSAEPMSFTADYLFRQAKAHPEYVELGKKVIARMEAKLVHTEGHPAAPAPAVSEQAGFQHMMPGHTARYCAALAQLYAVTGDKEAKRQALSGFNALTYMQSPPGLYRTMFQLVNEKQPKPNRENWYSQHLYSVCHVLEALPILPEIKKSK